VALLGTNPTKLDKKRMFPLEFVDGISLIIPLGVKP